jgi:hypothetical protein
MTQNALNDAVAQSRLLRAQLAPDERVVLTVQSGSMTPIMPEGPGSLGSWPWVTGAVPATSSCSSVAGAS